MNEDTGMVNFIDWDPNVINFPMDTDVQFDTSSQNAPINTAHDIVTKPLSKISGSKIDNDVIESYGFETNMVFVNIILLTFIVYLLLLLTDALGIWQAVGRILCWPCQIISKLFGWGTDKPGTDKTSKN